MSEGKRNKMKLKEMKMNKNILNKPKINETKEIKVKTKQNGIKTKNPKNQIAKTKRSKMMFVLCLLLLLFALLLCSCNLLGKEPLEEEAANVENSEALAMAETYENGYITQNIMVVDYVYYTTNPKDLSFDVPKTFEKDGLIYEYTNQVKYDVSKGMKGIAQCIRSETESKSAPSDKYSYTSDITGNTYSLFLDSYSFSAQIPIERQIKACQKFGPSVTKPIISNTHEITYYNRLYGKDETVEAKLTETRQSKPHFLPADEPILGTFYTDEYASQSFIIGWEDPMEEGGDATPIQIPLDFLNSAVPSWEGYEEMILEHLALDPALYRITGAWWCGDFYEKLEHQKEWDRDIVVAYRDAAYSYEACVSEWEADYEACVTDLGYECISWYFASEEELKKEGVKSKDLETFYRVCVSATYECTQDFRNPELTKRLMNLKETNPDVYGILTIPDTVLNHPLMRCETQEDYYLRRNIKGEHDTAGLPFITLDSNLNAPGSNSIIYGHNIHKTGHDVFCDLANYEDLAYYKEHPVVEIYTENGLSRYLIIAFYFTDLSDTDNYFPYWETTTFESEKEFEAYMQNVENRSFFHVPVSKTIEDSYITLSSCSNNSGENKTGRMVVLAKKLKMDESEAIPVWLAE